MTRTLPQCLGCAWPEPPAYCGPRFGEGVRVICRLCEGSELRPYYTQGNQGEFRFHKCGTCGLVNYDLSSGLNQEKYADVYQDPFDPSLKTNRSQAQTFAFIDQRLRSRQGPGRVLDIGCGNGGLLHLLKSRGWDVHGLELSPFLARSVRETLGIPVDTANFLEYDPPAEDAFDLVILRHVLEHLPSPHVAMGQLNRFLQVGGSAVLEFPNIEAWDLKFKRLLQRRGWQRKRYRPDYKPGHCNEYSKGSFAYLASKTGFEVEVWETYSYKRLANLIYNHFPIGNKARTILRKVRNS